MLTLVIVSACKKSESSSREIDRAKIDKLGQEILDRIDKISCDNAEDWRPEAFGAKSCGGPQKYIPYPKGADESGELLDMIKAYNAAESEFNIKHMIPSDCNFILPPKELRCEDGKPFLYYPNIGDEGIN